MTFDLSALSAPFDHAAVHWRVQGQPFERNGEHSAMALAYLDARDVMDRLDQVCGPENWQTEYHETPKGRLICRLSICIEGAWVTKSDGAGDTDVEGEKGAISDALKRAAVSWGIGRYLYRLDSPWVPCEVKQSNGKVYWKSWKVDPWTKIRNAPATSAKAEERKSSGPSQDEIAHERAVNDAQAMIESADSLPDLQGVWRGLKPTTQADRRVIAAKDARKSALQAAPANADLGGDEIPY